VEATRAVRQAEVGAARTMLERTAERFSLKPERLAGDSAYGAAEISVHPGADFFNAICQFRSLVGRFPFRHAQH
jgi:hypothetical protein